MYKFLLQLRNVFFIQRLQRQKHNRKRTGEGLTNIKQWTKTRRARKHKNKMDSPVTYPKFKWAEFGSIEYLKAIDEINDMYRKMITIGESKKVFHDKVCPMISAKTQDEFKRERRHLSEKYWNYTRKSKTVLTKISDDVAFVPHPHKYRGSPAKRLPTLREIIARERILEFEHYMETLNMFRCSTCRECNIESKPLTDSLMYECKSCQKRGDSKYYTKNNLHPVWYLVDDDGNYVLDENDDKEIQYHIPEELACLTMYEKLLIRRCANFVPSVHLKNGVFGINGHCVTFPQDITEMCDELPQRKETLLTFVRNIGSKDMDNVFPTSLRVNRLKVVRALKWLQKHNPFYRNIKIKEENFDWMNGAEEVNMGSDGVVLNMKESARSKMKETEDEHVSNVHSTDQDVGDDTLPMRTVHANQAIKVPSGRQAEPIKELVDIAHKTNQTAKIMTFPPIDHDSAIS